MPTNAPLTSPSTTSQLQMGTVTKINSYDEFKKLIAGEKPVVIDFNATWCGPCRTISPVFEKLAQDVDSAKLQFYSVDVDEQTKIAEEVGIRAMPSFIVFKNGEKVDSLVGANPPQLVALVQSAQA